MSAIINALKKALEADPENRETRQALAEAYRREGYADEARALAGGLKIPPVDAPSPRESDADPEVHLVVEADEPDAGPAAPIVLTVSDAIVEVTPEDVEQEVPARTALVAPPPESLVGDISKSIPDPPVLTVRDTGEAEEEAADSAAEESLREHQAESVERYRQGLRMAKVQSLTLTTLVHVLIFFLLSVIVISVPRRQPPQIVAVAAPTPPVVPEIKKKVEMPTPRSNPTASSRMPDIVSAMNFSDMAIPTMDQVPMDAQAVYGTSFRPSRLFGPSGDVGMPMLFGEPIEGKTLGVILDVSGSMAEFLPKVIREIDRNFDLASIIFVNHTILRTTGSETEVRPIATDDVVPVVDGLRTPFWFLWGDLPRKAEQAAVDRLIHIFKTRPNCYLAVGGHNRVAGSMDHLRSLGIDALYVFSDFEDFVEEEAAVENARKLSKAGIKVYVQPAQEKTEFLEIMSRKIASRTDGKELPPLISIAEPVEEAPMPLLAEVMDPIPIEVEGVNFATARPTRYGTEFYDFRSPSKGFEVIEVFEHRNFDLVLYGPNARAEIFLKTEEGYILRPVSFRYHSRKYFQNDRGDITWRQRKWLRNREPPLLEGNEITWKMVLEDEINFDVWFVFKENTFMAAYGAELAPREFDRGDGASILFHVPPIAIERKDIYYSHDFPQGFDLDHLREAVAPNHLVFNLSTKEVDRYRAHWSLYGYQRGINIRPFNVLCKRLPNGIFEAKVQGQSYGPRVLTVGVKQNDILLNGSSHRPDIEPWEGFSFHLTRPADRTRHRLTKTKAFELTVE